MLMESVCSMVLPSQVEDAIAGVQSVTSASVSFLSPESLTSASNDITCYLSQNAVDARTLLPRGTTGYIVLFWEGDVVGQKMTVFPVTVTD